jgi:hypothetical protein
MRRPHLATRAIPDDDLLRHLRDACVAAGRVLSQKQFERRGKSGDPGCPGYRPYRRRWGRWANVLAALRVWVAAHDPGFPHRRQLPGADAVADPPLVPPPPSGDYGEAINIPGMLHAPVNAAGVVLLFGVLARELGFAIAHVSGAPVSGAQVGGQVSACEPPSCEARRRHGDVWERRRLAFAFASQDLKGRELKNRDPAGCDLLVCWTHDWPDCPVEVVELKREAAKHA